MKNCVNAVLFNYLPNLLAGTWLCSCYDLELDGYVHLSDQFIEKLKEQNVITKLQENSDVLTINIPSGSQFIENLNLGKSRRFLSFRGKRQPIIDDFIEFISQKGSKRLVTVSKNIKNILKIEKGTNRRLKLADLEYLQKLTEIVTHALKQNSTSDFDREILLLSIIESANKLLYSASRNFLNAVVDAQVTALPKNHVQAVTEAIYSDNIKYKKDDFKYICMKLTLCRPFPGYSDYFADLTSEILQMSNSKVHNILLEVIDIVRNKRKFFETLLGNDLSDAMGASMQKALCGPVTHARQVISVFRGVISHRYTWISNKKQELKIKTTAIRVLLDIIDQVFDTDGAEIVAMHFDSTVKAVRGWEESTKKGNLEEIVSKVVNYSVDTLDTYLDTVSKNEIKVLSQAIYYSSYNITPEYKYLFYSGSKLTNVNA